MSDQPRTNALAKPKKRRSNTDLTVALHISPDPTVALQCTHKPKPPTVTLHLSPRQQATPTSQSQAFGLDTPFSTANQRPPSRVMRQCSIVYCSVKPYPQTVALHLSPRQQTTPHQPITGLRPGHAPFQQPISDQPPGWRCNVVTSTLKIILSSSSLKYAKD